MVSVIIAETMMQLNQALRKNIFQSGLYLMVDLPSNSYKTLYRDFNIRSKIEIIKIILNESYNNI